MLRLLLDYDGTLHHCLKIYAPAFRLAYRSLVDRGYRPERTWQAGELVRWLGLTPSAMWEAFAPDLPRAVREGCAKQIEGEMLRLTAAGEARLYPGVPEALEKLRGMGCSLILLSNCQRAYLEAHARAFQLERYFDGLYCTEDYGWPSKGALFSVIRRDFPGNYAAVGDRASDRELARRHGLPFVGCRYGYGAPEELEGAELLISSPEELPDAAARLI